MQRTDDGIVYEDGVLELRDGRKMAWRWWGDPDGRPLLRIQGTPASRLYRNPDSSVQRDLGVRYLMIDRPGYGGSTRKLGRGIADVADDLAAVLEAHGIDRIPAMGTSGGGPHVLGLAARHPDRVSAVTVVVGGTPLEPDEVEQLVGVNAQGYAAAEKGWDALHELLVQVRERLLGAEGMAGVLSDAPASDRALMADPAWQRIERESLAETLKQGAEGWTDESMAMHHKWDFDPAEVKTSVTWWHGDDDKNAPITAARRVVAQLPRVDLRIWHEEGHFASLVHDKEIVQELLSRA
ncbi:MAG TPA: alpha/beta hydrolase [Candidatus Dormibacteraeota bacterium]